MRAMIIAVSITLLSGLLISADALASPTPAYPTDQTRVARAMPSGALLAGGKFSGPGASPGNKLNDKALVGKAGGRTGIGGTESVVFRKKK